MPPESDGSRYRAKLLQVIGDHKSRSKEFADKDPAYIKFKCLVNGEREDVVVYNDIIDYIEKDQTLDGIFGFKRIISHKYVKPGDPDYMGSAINLQMEWETNEITWLPAWDKKKKYGVYVDDPVTLAQYALDNGLLDDPRWQFPRLRRLARNKKRMVRMAKQTKLHSFRTKPKYMFGYLVPRNHQHAMEIDAANGNNKWREAELIELGQIDEYNSFVDKGVGYKPGPEYKKINVHLVYAVKHDGRHKA